MEQIRELAKMLESGISEYDEQLEVLQSERLKYIRLSMTGGFGTGEDQSQESWLLHLKQLEDSLEVRLKALRQVIQESAASFQEPEVHEPEAKA